MKKQIGVVGGSCVDIFATSAMPLIAHDSNPGAVTIGYGGVGRNIAENLARLEQNVLLFAAFGGDPVSADMLKHTAASGVDTRHCVVSADDQAPYYIALNEADGDLYAAVNDMKVCERITPDYLEQKLDTLNQCGALMLDTNIPEASIHYLATHCQTPLFADAVSVRKAEKLRSSLPRLFALKCNLQEAQALLQSDISADLPSLQDAANRFHAMGIRWVLLTLGIQGAFISGEDGQLLRNAYSIQTVNANGCGDAFAAAAFLHILRRESPDDILRHALAAAAITAQSAQAVAKTIGQTTILSFLERQRS